MPWKSHDTHGYTLNTVIAQCCISCKHTNRSILGTFWDANTTVKFNNCRTGQLFATRTISWIFVTLRCVVKGIILNNFPPYVGSIVLLLWFSTYFSISETENVFVTACCLEYICVNYQCRRGLECYWRKPR